MAQILVSKNMRTALATSEPIIDRPYLRSKARADRALPIPFKIDEPVPARQDPVIETTRRRILPRLEAFQLANKIVGSPGSDQEDDSDEEEDEPIGRLFANLKASPIRILRTPANERPVPEVVRDSPVLENAVAAARSLNFDPAPRAQKAVSITPLRLSPRLALLGRVDYAL
jgi:hypothetical protein